MKLLVYPLLPMIFTNCRFIYMTTITRSALGGRLKYLTFSSSTFTQYY